ncbi:MAG: ChbG/HpnK family deacetylase [Methylocystis sp.]|nr:ChbG/HpnK family deacetylase [Methylocystis sp.]
MAKDTTVALCADDFGLSMGVSAGILEALAAARLSAVSAIATSSRWPATGRELTRRVIDADVGLHFNLTLGRPLARMRKFAPQGVFPSVAEVVRAALRGKLPMDEIRVEIDRQLDRFEAVMERAPDHVDGHQHVHALPFIRTALFEALEARHLVGKVWLRDPGDRLHRILIRGGEAKKALAVRSLSHGFRRAAKRRGFATNDGFAGFADFDPSGDYGARFETYLYARGRRHLIMCHPGYVDADLRAQDPVTVAREQELAFLLSPEFEELLARHKLKLARLSRAG